MQNRMKGIRKAKDKIGYEVVAVACVANDNRSYEVFFDPQTFAPRTVYRVFRRATDYGSQHRQLWIRHQLAQNTMILSAIKAGLERLVTAKRLEPEQIPTILAELKEQNHVISQHQKRANA
jgi:hypothetical protein